LLGPLQHYTYTFSPADYGVAFFDAVLNSVGSQSITATDSVNAAATGAQTGIGVRLALTVSGPQASYLNQTLTYNLGTLGDPAGTVFTYQINWGDGGTQTVAGASLTQVAHAYTTAGYRYATVTVADSNGHTASTYWNVDTVPVTVAIQTDPARTSQQMLVIKDTGYGDSLYLSSAANNSVALSVGYDDLGTIAPTNGKPFALVIVSADTTSYAGIYASQLAISSVLVGGAGNNYLYGGSARNLLIAGRGYGYLAAGGGGDILIAGYTKYDSNSTALAYLMAEWDSGDSYSTRISKISKGGGLNGAYVLNSTTVSQNGMANDLYGGALSDWFFAHTSAKKNNADKIHNQAQGETVTQL
jgi:hypothetical protein